MNDNRMPVFTQTVDLPRQMTGAEIKAALKNAAGSEFRTGFRGEDHKLGTQPKAEPIGLAMVADPNGTLITNDGVYTQVVVISNAGWGGLVYAVRRSNEYITEYCQETIKKFLANIK